MNAIDWAAVIGRAGEYYRMRTPPSAERIEAVQAALDTRFPQELRDLCALWEQEGPLPPH